ncbi:MAG: EGF domain-containing protein [Myxococcota bacterium]
MRLLTLGCLAALAFFACGTTSGPCNARTCQGCCTAAGACEAGNTASACGSLGGTCRDCAGLGLTCTLGTCSTVISGNGGGAASGGGSGGGGGGSVTGGGGGATGGGTGGGAATGGGGGSSACAINNGGCAAEALCTPQGTSRVCTCTSGYVGDGFTCADVNECLTNNGGCATTATCTNTPGGRTCTCPTGYTGSGVTCTDVDECLTNNGGCSANATCTNTPGSRTCACRAGFTGDGFTCTASTPVWTIELVTTLGGSASDLALDGAGVPAIAFVSDSPRGVYFRRRLGANAWSSPETVDSQINAMDPSLVFSGSAWVVANSVLDLSLASVSTWRRPASSASWSFEASYSPREQPDLAVGAGREHLVFGPRTATSTVYYASRAAGTSTWSTPGVVTSVAGGFPSAVAANDSGALAVAYVRGSDLTLWLARSSGLGTSWTTTQLTTGQVWYVDLALDASNVAHLVYYDGQAQVVRYESWSGSTRTAQLTLDSGGAGAGSQWYSGPAIALDAAGAVHVSYLDFAHGQNLRYATNRSGSFVVENVVGCGNVLGRTSIAVDANRAPHISFPLPASSFGNLGYAVKR